MASATIVLKTYADANVTFTNAGQTSNGAVYKDSTRALSLPRTLEFSYGIGNPGAKGNDRLTVTIKDSVQNSTTGLVSTGSIKVELSVPRDATWTETMTKDLMGFLQELFVNANIDAIADGMIP